MEKNKRDFEDHASSLKKGFLFGALLIGISLFLARPPQKQILPAPVISPISLDLTCLTTLNAQNIDQMQMLAVYDAHYGSAEGARVRFSSDGSLLAITTDLGLMDKSFKTDMNRKTSLFGRSMLRPYIHANFI